MDVNVFIAQIDNFANISASDAIPYFGYYKYLVKIN